MAKITIPVLFFLAFVAMGKLNAGEVPASVDFHENGVIQEGDEYSYVNVRDNAIVVMTGGELWQLSLHDSSTATIIGGLTRGISLFGSNTVNLYGGDIHVLTAPTTPNGYFHIYGYDFTLDTSNSTAPTWRLTGLWPDGTPLQIDLQRAYAYGDHYVLHELPEPATVILLASGVLMLRTRHCQSSCSRQREKGGE